MRATPARSPAGVHRRRLQAGVAVLLVEVALERLGGRVHQVAAQASDRAVGKHVLVHRVLAPPRAPAIEQARVPVGIAFAVPQPAAEEAIAARHRECRDGGRGCAQRGLDLPGELRRKALVRVETEHPVVTRLLPTAKFFCAPNPSHSCSITRAPRRRAISTVSSALPESTTMHSAAKGTDARHASRLFPASRVITQRLRGVVMSEHSRPRATRARHCTRRRVQAGAATSRPQRAHAGRALARWPAFYVVSPADRPR